MRNPLAAPWGVAGWLFLWLLLWHGLVYHAVTLRAAFWLVSVPFASLWLGEVFIYVASQRSRDATTCLLAGMLLGNLVLAGAALLLPFDLTTDWLIVVFITAAARLRLSNALVAVATQGEHTAESVLLLMMPFLVTIWCRDLLGPIEMQGEFAVIRAWSDIYYHVSEIHAVAATTGLQNMSDVQMSGAVPRPYHLASYLLPALLAKTTGNHALGIYASFLVPVGLLMTGLAAYSLANSAFGQWPGLVGAMAVMILPDAYQQGFGNQFFRYQWLLQIAPAGSYGIASAAVASMLVLAACRIDSVRLAIAGYAFVLVTLCYKAQIFVAISYPLLVLPALFIGSLERKRRISLMLGLTGAYLGILYLSQTLPFVPDMRLNGSGLARYSAIVLANQGDGLLKTAFSPILTDAARPWVERAVALGVLLVFCSFGTYVALYAALIRSLKQKLDTSTWLFPVLTTAVYLTMATCFPLDDRQVGAAEELLHRPFVWALFILMIWCSSGAYKVFVGDALPPRRRRVALATLGVVAIALIPVRDGAGIQTMSRWGRGFQQIPICRFEVATYLRKHSDPMDIVQDSRNDHDFTLEALSERLPFAIDTGRIRAPSGIGERLAALQMIKSERDPTRISDFMKVHAIRWYVTSPGDGTVWAETLRDHLALDCSGHRAYHF